MDMRKHAGENYLKIDDVRDGPRRVTIALIKIGNYDRPEAIFDDDSILSLNVGNTRTLSKSYGADSKGWIGREIELQLGKDKYQGESRTALLLFRSPRPLTRSKCRQRKKAPPQAPTLNDEVPF